MGAASEVKVVKIKTVKNDEPEDGKLAYEQAVEHLTRWQLPCSATEDDGFIPAIIQLQKNLGETKAGSMMADLVIKLSLHARMIILRHKNAMKCNWSPASCAMLFRVFQQFQDMDLNVRAMHNLHSERKKTINKGIAPHSVVRQKWEAHRSMFPQEPKAVSRAAVLALIRKEYPEQTIRGIADATRSGLRGRPKR